MSHPSLVDVGHRVGSGDEFERVAMRGPHDMEVTVVEGGDPLDAVSFGESDERGIGAAEAEICVALDELADAFLARGVEVLDAELAVEDRRVERHLSVGAEFSVK